MAGSTLGPVLFFAGIKDPRRGPGGPDFAPQPRHSRIEPSLDPNLNYPPCQLQVEYADRLLSLPTSIYHLRVLSNEECMVGKRAFPSAPTHAAQFTVTVVSSSQHNF